METVKAKLVVLDIDGTILDKPVGVPVHKKVRKAVKEARQAGVKVCLCSARPCYYMQDATQGLDDLDALIGCSGAMIEQQGKILFKDPVPLPQLLACFETAKEKDIYMSFAGDEKIYVCKKGPVFPPLEHGSKFVVMEDMELLEMLRKNDFYCAYAFTKTGVTKEEVFEDPRFLTATIHKSSHDSFNLTHGKTTKGTAVTYLAELWGIRREEILTIGNDENDIPMFEASGTGVAVSNASPEVIAAADWVAPDVRHGGAADAIKRFAL